MNSHIPEQNRTVQSRRDFLKMSAGATAAALALSGADSRAESQTIRAALIGCGGRGAGAARDCLEAANAIHADVRLVMMADVFEDRLARSRKALSGLAIDVPDDRCCLGFDAYKKVMASDVDLVLLATPPNFRPVHFAAAVAAGKHVFMEKPVAVDPVGCQRIMQAGTVAEAKRLSVAAGTQRRHERGYRAVAQALNEGAIGKVYGGTIHFCLGGGSIGSKPADMPDWAWLIRGWGGWWQMSGDHIVEQHVHSIDVANWMMGAHPVRCVCFGGRARRRGGNMYDFFSADYEYPDEVHICLRSVERAERELAVGQTAVFSQGMRL